MSDSQTEISLEEHDVIRAEVRFLADSMADIGQKLEDARTDPDEASQAISSLRLALSDFRDGLKRHIEADERILLKKKDNELAKKLRRQHGILEKELDQVISQVEAAGEAEGTGVTAFVSRIKEEIQKISDSTLAHIEAEDKLLKQG